MLRYALIALVMVPLVTACSKEDTTEVTASVPAVGNTSATVRWYTSEQVSLGARIFAEHCAVCHGAQAQGVADWRSRGPDGKFPPPPLNGTAHGWHHPLAQLRHVIKNGGDPRYGNMPAWGGTLSDSEIDAVIAWFQSHWPNEIYQAWLEIESRAQQTKMPGTS